MIAFIKGELIECQLNMAIIQVGGIGYQVNIPLTTSEKLPPLGKEIKLYTLQPTGKTHKHSTVSWTANPGIFSE